ncbi:hypothetical protein X798_06151 [Onchocerca flexuosa]|uniref:Uncharacterized protein n=1 Tax=Onchocerca flexuosa TaxID=387005 RepID=A0A238BN59_9BILA|nr:hypothetical protein X798_06151 [Onchocerca flexuosa]
MTMTFPIYRLMEVFSSSFWLHNLRDLSCKNDPQHYGYWGIRIYAEIMESRPISVSKPHIHIHIHAHTHTHIDIHICSNLPRPIPGSDL